MRKISILIIMFSLVICKSASAGYGSVLDNNNGNKGQVLINSGKDNGNSDVGTWTDSDFLKGDKGDQGEKGDIGTAGQDGTSGKDGTNGEDGGKGDKGEQGIEGKGLKHPLELQYEAVIKSWKKVDLSVYYIRDFNNETDTLGVKVKHYWGKSWSERELERVNARLDALENK